MEIDIDTELVHGILSQEQLQAGAEISQLGVLQAYANSQQRHDARLAAAADATSLACKAGCHWCCYFTVDVRPVEVFRILDVIETELPPQEQARVRREIAANSAALSQLDAEERTQRNLKCPFLSSGRCVIYAARPQTCRNYHATDVAGCEQSFKEPDNLDIDPEFAPLVYQSGAAHVDAFSAAMHAAGYDVAAYELSTALAAAMRNPFIARQRFEDKQHPFAQLQGSEVPAQFSDE